jgi:hypothetical protein
MVKSNSTNNASVYFRGGLMAARAAADAAPPARESSSRLFIDFGSPIHWGGGLCGCTLVSTLWSNPGGTYQLKSASRLSL